MPEDIWDKIIAEAANDTTEDYLNKVSGLIRLTNEEIKRAIPPEVDHKKFGELMKVVQDATKSNLEKAEAIRNVSGYAEIAAGLLKRLL